MPSRSRGAPRPTPLPGARRQRSRAQTGLDHQHDLNRGRLMVRHTDGRRCWWCGRPMYKDPKRNFDGHPLEADHSKSRSRYGAGNTHADRLLHKKCNIQRGDGTHDDQRPTLLALTTAPQPTQGATPLAIGWPWPPP
jgi:hypothetical protein